MFLRLRYKVNIYYEGISVIEGKKTIIEKGCNQIVIGIKLIDFHLSLSLSVKICLTFPFVTTFYIRFDLICIRLIG